MPKARQREHLKLARMAKATKVVDELLHTTPATGWRTAQVDLGSAEFDRRRDVARRLLAVALVPQAAPQAVVLQRAATSAARIGSFCSSGDLPEIFPMELVELHNGTQWVTTTMECPLGDIASAREVCLLQQFVADAQLVRRLVEPMSKNTDGSQSGRLVYHGFQACIGRRQRAKVEEPDILAHYRLRPDAVQNMPLRSKANDLQSQVVVRLLWRWFLQTASRQAAEHSRVISEHNLWDACIVPGIPVLSIVLTVGWQRVIHVDTVVAPLFGVWFGGRQTGGNFAFPEYGLRHDDVRDGNVRVAAWDGSCPHATTTIDDGDEGRFSLSIFLSRKTLDAAKCSSKRRRRHAPLSPRRTGKRRKNSATSSATTDASVADDDVFVTHTCCIQ